MIRVACLYINRCDLSATAGCWLKPWRTQHFLHHHNVWRKCMWRRIASIIFGIIIIIFREEIEWKLIAKLWVFIKQCFKNLMFKSYRQVLFWFEGMKIWSVFYSYYSLFVIVDLSLERRASAAGSGRLSELPGIWKWIFQFTDDPTISTGWQKAYKGQFSRMTMTRTPEHNMIYIV